MERKDDVGMDERKKRKKEDHKGCFQGTLFVQGTTNESICMRLDLHQHLPCP